MRTLKFCGGTHVDLNLISKYPILQLDIKFIDKEDVAQFWNAICVVIDEHLRSNKGVILPGIGNFTYITKQKQLGEDIVQCVKEPIFIISDKLTVSNWLQRPKVYFDEIVPSKYLNFFLLSNYLNTDNCRLRKCYTAILTKLQHFILIRRSFTLPFPGIGKFVFRDSNYWFTFNKSFLVTQKRVYATNADKHKSPTYDECNGESEMMGYPQVAGSEFCYNNSASNSRKQNSVVGRSMKIAKQIKSSPDFQRCLDLDALTYHDKPCTCKKTKKKKYSIPSTTPFVISYSKPCLGKCAIKKEILCPSRHDPDAIFQKDYTGVRKKKKCIHQEDLETCPAARPPKDDTIVDRLQVDRLLAGDDTNRHDLSRFGQNTRKAFDAATENYRKQRAVKKYSDDDLKEAIIKRHGDKEYLRNVQKRRDMIIERLQNAHEFDLMNTELLTQRANNEKSENDFNNQFIFTERALTPPWRNAKRKNEEDIELQRECKANRKQFLSQREKEDSIKLQNIYKQRYANDVMEEKKTVRDKIKKQKELLDAMDPHKPLLDNVKGEYFEIPQLELDRHRIWCRERKTKEAKDNYDKYLERKMQVQNEKQILRDIEANLTKDLNIKMLADIEQRKKDRIARQLLRLEDVKQKCHRELVTKPRLAERYKRETGVDYC